MINTRFESIGLYLPETVISTREIINQLRNKPIFDFEEITGIKNRRKAADSDSSYTLAIKAAEDCLSHSKYKPSDIQAVICASITRFDTPTRFVYEPSMSLMIRNHFGMNSKINFDISNACAGMLNGVYILHNLIKSGYINNGIIVSGERITYLAETAIKEIKDPIDDQFASLTLGDSGGALIIDDKGNNQEQIDLIDFVSFPEYVDLCIGMPSDINPGIAMYTKSSEINKSFIIHWPSIVDNAFKANGRTFNPLDYDYIIFHQTAVRPVYSLLNSGKTYFGQEMPQTIISVDEYGNTSTTCHNVALYQAIKNKKIIKGSKVMMVALAAGVIIGCLSTTIGELKVSQ